MARRIPYLQCRQPSPGAYFFRHAIPCTDYKLFGYRETTRTVRTSDRKIAEARTLELAALSDPTDNVVDLEPGADDYVANPFDLREILSREELVNRKPSGSICRCALAGKFHPGETR